MSSERTALLGYTGYVGSNLLAQQPFTDVYNSSNVNSIIGRRYDRIVCAAAPGFKLGATTLKQTFLGAPYDDAAALRSLAEVLAQVECTGTFVLISTLSVYAVTSDEESAALHPELGPVDRDHPTHCLDERREVWSRNLARGGASDHEYGRNRAALEHWLLTESPFRDNCLIVRLPGIFGQGMKKNYLYDLITSSEWLYKVDLNTRHQWYPLARLSGDIDAALAENVKRIERGDAPLRVINLFPEDVLTEDIVRTFFLQHLPTCRRGERTFIDAVRSTPEVRAAWARETRSDDGVDSALFRFSAVETMEHLRSFLVNNEEVLSDIRSAAVARKSKELKASGASGGSSKI